jgi:hypothetical protein
MNSRLHLALTISFLFLFFAATAQNYRWAHGFGGPTYDAQGTSISTDANANVYVTGTFGDSLDFDPGGGTAMLAPFNFPNATTMFVAKYDSAGHYIWAFCLGGNNIVANPTSLAVNATGVYVTGSFGGTADFDPSVATANLNDSSGYIFLAHYDLNGNYLWAKNMVHTYEGINSIAIDNIGNSYITGFFQDSADFDPGAGVAMLFSNTNSDTFFAKYDSSGNFVWGHDLCDSNGASSGGKTVAFDNNSNDIYITGSFQGTVDFDRGPGVFNLAAVNGITWYVAKYDTSGSFVWAGDISGPTGKVIYSIAPDLTGTGDFYISGSASDSVDFDLTSNDSVIYCYTGRAFFCKYDSNSHLIFVHLIGGSGRGILTDLSGNIYLTGSFGGTVDFDPGPGVANLTSAGSVDIFFAKYDSSGSYLWAKRVGGFFAEQGQAIAIDNLGSQYLTGFFHNTVDFDPDTGVVNLSGSSNQTIFISKYSDLTNSISEFFPKENQNLSVFPNPSSNLIYVRGIEQSISGNKLCISDMEGRNVFQTTVLGNIKINVSNFKPGVYLIAYFSSNQIQRTMFVKQ